MPTSTKSYNLRETRSKDGSPIQGKRSSPTKRSLPQSPTKQSTKSPLKKQPKLNSYTSDIIPETIIKFIEEKGIDLQSSDQVAFVGEADRSPAERLKEEIYQAWINYLKAVEKGENPTAWNKSTLKSLSASKMNLSEQPSTKATVLRRSDLIKQRANLKKCKGPQKKKIEVCDLKLARDNLIQLPVGKALKDKVSIPILTEMKGKLRSSQK